MELKYFKGLKKELSISKRYRELAKQYHPDKAVNDTEKELFHIIMQEINAEHQEVLVLLKYNALSNNKNTQTLKDNIAPEQNEKQNIIKNIVSFFGLTEEQEHYFINQGREVLTTFYDNIIENNLRKL